MVSFQRPLARRAFRTRRPLRVDMRFIKPCSRLRGMRLGCQVRFIKKPCTPPLKIVLSIIAAKPMRCQSGVPNLGPYIHPYTQVFFLRWDGRVRLQWRHPLEQVVCNCRSIYGASGARVPFLRTKMVRARAYCFHTHHFSLFYASLKRSRTRPRRISSLSCRGVGVLPASFWRLRNVKLVLFSSSSKYWPLS